ncbi:MAG: protein-glutamate O-methyltransferase CheR [Opitutales bacterium]|nr:protein-glutamate O-methyltransferase CheR [Opitutales bacterium]
MLNSLTESDYHFIRDLVYEHSRINLGDGKRELVFARIGKRMRLNGISSPEAYCELLRSTQGLTELGHLIDVISTNHTHFFREYAHFEFLQQVVLPEWRNLATGQRMNVWSAASSSGEEPYSIAMALDRWMPRLNLDLDWRILATDISSRMLDRAREGSYKASAVEAIDRDWRSCFNKEKVDGELQYRVKDHIRRKVSYHQINLLGKKVPKEATFDLIFCRNVMIYFDRQTQTELIARLQAALKPGAYLMVGHSESLGGIDHGLRLIRPSIYRKTP